MTRVTSTREVCLLCLFACLLLFIRRPKPMLNQQQEQQHQQSVRPQPFNAPEQAIIDLHKRSSKSGLLTVREMKERMLLPCNFVHDGYYLDDSNEMLNQVYQSLLELDNDIVPVFVECGGHDGITKSLSLKASICLSMNTLLIEASPKNYNVLKQSRSCDFTVNAALCDGDSVQLLEKAENSGETHIAPAKSEGTVTAKCTSIDAELEKLQNMLPAEQQDKLKLIFLVLDIEGHEAFAINGIQKFIPQKAFMETKILSRPHQRKVNRWAAQHNLTGRGTGRQNMCYNFHPMISEQPDHLKKLLYGARSAIPESTYQTSEASKAYMFYGE